MEAAFKTNAPDVLVFKVMVTLKLAIENAMTFAREVLGPSRTLDLELEEIESDVLDGQNVWHITLSMRQTTSDPSAALGNALTFLARQRRDYRVFTVQKSDGEVLAMKIRDIPIH